MGHFHGGHFHHHVHHHFGFGLGASRYNPILAVIGSIYLALLVTTFRRHLQTEDLLEATNDSNHRRTTVSTLAERLEHHAQSMSLLHDYQMTTSTKTNRTENQENKEAKRPSDSEQQKEERLSPQQWQQILQQYPPHPVPHPPTHTMGICLLIKDDNDLLPEFIAYHYHAVDLRHLVVAVDPTSATSPTVILERFHRHLPDFNYVVWNDTDYMYDWFLAGNYTKLPNFIGHNFNATTNQSTWDDSPQFQQSNAHEVLHGINIHRFRQAVFVGECIRYLKNENIKTKINNIDHSKLAGNATTRRVSEKSPLATSYLRYMAHIDTDEILVVNPHFLSRDIGRNDPRFLNLTLNVNETADTIPTGNNSQNQQPWLTLEASSVRQLLEVWHRQYPFKERSCRYLPRILMGAVERGEVPHSPAVRKSSTVVPPIDPSFVPDGFDPFKFESLRFKWHATYNDNPTNGFGKVILDLDELRKGRERLLDSKSRVSGIHQISPNLCGKNVPLTSEIWDNRPLATYHYLGSVERHCGKDDPRRNTKLHHKKSIAASKFPDGPWLDQWLNKFVEVQGLEKSRQLLPEYLSSQPR